MIATALNWGFRLAVVVIMVSALWDDFAGTLVPALVLLAAVVLMAWLVTPPPQ